MEKTIRWGIIGTGNIGIQFAQGLQAVSDAKLLAVGSRNQDAANEFSRALGAPHAYGSYEDLVNDPDVDVVYVATPHVFHKEHCMVSLEAGKAVLCEKPFTLNAHEAQEVVVLARRKNLFCMEGMWMRFIPLMQTIMKIVAAGEIGEVRLVTADFGLPVEFDPAARSFNPALGGGSFLDLGVYGMSLAHQLLGSPSAITSELILGPTGVDEQGAIILRYPNGQMAILYSSLQTHSPHEAHIMGTHGSIRIHSPFFCPHRATITKFSKIKTSPKTQDRGGLVSAIKQWPLVKSCYQRLSGVLAPLCAGNQRTLVRPVTGNGYNYEAEEVTRCLQQDRLESPIMPLQDTLQVLQLMDDVRRQANLTYPQEEHKFTLV
jgi:dihydrodiol dehydrogenase / D-xylose 1-dehydrogenase (NADP)